MELGLEERETDDPVQQDLDKAHKRPRRPKLVAATSS
jgi:hypothetical protein